VLALAPQPRRPNNPRSSQALIPGAGGRGVHLVAAAVDTLIVLRAQDSRAAAVGILAVAVGILAAVVGSLAAVDSLAAVVGRQPSAAAAPSR
jgi:hypothetical protein